MNPFEYCIQLRQINVSPNHPTLETIDGVLFDKTTGTLICYPCAFTGESYAVPEGTESIGVCAFANCDSLAAIVIPDGVTTIGDDAFFSCDSLAAIVIPDSVTSIGDDAFANCDSLTLTVSQGSYAEAYAAENEIPYTC